MAGSVQRLAGKAALVTGSTTGIGEAIVRAFAREGASVLVHGRREAEAKALVELVVEQYGVTAGYFLGSLEDPDFALLLVEAAVEQLGKIDILVNNAALMTRSNIETTDAATFDRTIAVNLRAPLLLSRAAIPYFRAQGGGAILNIGSVNGYCGEVNQLAYSISKGGLMTLSRNLADAHGHEHIRVNHFNVGWVLTPNENALKISEGLPSDWTSKLQRNSAPSGRLLTPDEIASVAVTFVSPESGPISGAVVELEQYPLIGRNPPKDTA